MTAVATTPLTLRERAIALVEREAADRVSKEGAYRAKRVQDLLEQIVHNLRETFDVDESVTLTPRLLPADDPLAIAMASGAVWPCAVVEYDGLLFAMTESGWHLRVVLECIGCKRQLVAHDARTVRQLGEALSADDNECRECWIERDASLAKVPPAIAIAPPKSRVVWPSGYDEEAHDPKITLAENSRIIANNLAVIATALDDINQNGLLR